MNSSKKARKIEKENKKRRKMKDETTKSVVNVANMKLTDKKGEGEEPSGKPGTLSKPSIGIKGVANVTWDIDCASKVAMYNAMDVGELEWDEDEETPPGAVLPLASSEETKVIPGSMT